MDYFPLSSQQPCEVQSISLTNESTNAQRGLSGFPKSYFCQVQWPGLNSVIWIHSWYLKPYVSVITCNFTRFSMNLTNTCNVRQGPQPELQGTHSLPMIEPDLHSPREHTGELSCQHDSMKTSAHLLSSWTSETVLKKTKAFKFKAFGNHLEAKSDLVKKTFESSELTSFVTERGEFHT